MSAIKAEKIEFIHPDLIVPWEKNANTHSDDQIDMLCRLIEASGFRDPLIISNRSGFLVAGHGRLLAAKKLKMDKLPVVYQDFENEAQEYQFMVSHNAIQGWSNLDLDKLKLEIMELPEIDLELLAIKDFKIQEINPVDGHLPDLNGEDPGCQQVTFILSNEQKDILDEAMEKARKNEDCSDEINQNKNGNTLSAILKKYVYS